MQITAKPGSKSALALVAASFLLLTACSAQDEQAEEKPHGYVEGAQELSEPKLKLGYLNNGSQKLQLLDLLSEGQSSVDLAGKAKSLVTDGRFGYLELESGKLQIIDSGVWTVDHGDHKHFYEAQLKSVAEANLNFETGKVVAQGPIAALSSAKNPNLELIDRRALEDGKLELKPALTGLVTNSFAVPYRNNLIVVQPGGDEQGKIEFRDYQGELLKDFGFSCQFAPSAQLLWSGVAIACDDSVILVKQEAGTEYAVKLDLKDGKSSDQQTKVISLNGRSSANQLAAVLSDGTVWLVDLSEEKAYKTGAKNAVYASIGRDGLAVVLLNSGILESYSVAAPTKKLAEAKLLNLEATPNLSPSSASARFVLDSSRLYLADPDNSKIYEIDYLDGLRLAREFVTQVPAEIIVEFGG